MGLIETDLLLAASSPRDAHHGEAVRLLRSGSPLRLSPYSLVELDLLVPSGRIRVVLPDFYVHLGEVLEFYGVAIPPPRARHLAVAWDLRRRYGLTYFDSLHAATALVEGEAIASYDSSYARVEGLKYLHPSQLAGRS